MECILFVLCFIASIRAAVQSVRAVSEKHPKIENIELGD